jgi:hypothetical protein
LVDSVYSLTQSTQSTIYALVRVTDLEERFALGALRLRSVPSELKAFLPQAQRSSNGAKRLKTLV